MKFKQVMIQPYWSISSATDLYCYPNPNPNLSTYHIPDPNQYPNPHVNPNINLNPYPNVNPNPNLNFILRHASGGTVMSE